MAAFDAALSAWTAHSSAPLAYVKTSSFETESRYFSYADMEAGRHLAPFAVRAVAQLPSSTCALACPALSLSNDGSRCVAAGGIRRGKSSATELAVAYYCVPASLVMSVYAGGQVEATFSAEVLRGRTLLDMQFATVHKRAERNTEWLVLLVRDETSKESSVWVVPSDVPDAAWRVIETEAYDPSKAGVRDASDPFFAVETISHVVVLPAHSRRSTALVFIVGSVRSDDGATDSPYCAYVRVDTTFDGAAIDATRRECVSPPSAVASTTHETVCLDFDCREVVRVPMDGGTDVRLQTLRAFGNGSAFEFDWNVQASRSATLPAEQRRLLDIDAAATLSLSQDGSQQLTRRVLSRFGSVSRGSFGGNETTIDVPLTGRGAVEDAWLQNVRLRLSVDSAGTSALDVRVASSFSTKQKMQTVVNCSVASCAGCHGSHPLQVDLQNKCFAAASCGIAQCVGTPVNMKRPLCQVAAMLGLQIALVRVNLAGFWDFFSRSIITVVELTQARRELYELSTAQETTMATVCSAKDGIVQTVATFGALYAQIPALTLDRASREPVSLQELRYNSERVMVATAVVEFLSQIGLGAVYVPLVASKVMQCQLNDAFLVIEGLGTIIAEGTTQADVARFRMGSAKFDKVDEFAVGMCLTDKFKQDMRDISDPAREQSMLSGLQDVLDGITGLVLTEKYGAIAFAFDAMCAWVLGMLSGAMNLMQVVDADNCRLPSADTLIAGSCVCGDVPARIPEPQRSSRRTDALWCRGPLLMTTVLADDALVWNPFSLTELLAQNKVQAYLDCLGVWGGNAGLCTGVRPANAFFDAQGVDVMQVIIRCRSNYQQKRWDEGSVAIGLLENAGDWQPGVVGVTSLVQMYGGGEFPALRKRLAQLSASIDGLSDLDEATHACLKSALYASDWNHNCAELALANGLAPPADSLLTYFAYGAYELDGRLRPDAAKFENADACESFSGAITARSASGVVYPKMAWDGDSENIVPVAELHNKLAGSDAQRVAQAEARLEELMRTQIEPAFAALVAVPIRDIEAEYVSLDGDAVHQTVDCVVLGPYAAADMLPSHKTLRDRFRTPQFHRGSASSREISYGLRTQGSPTRKSIMEDVVKHVAGTADVRLRELLLGVVDALRRAYTQRSNLYCSCSGGAAPSIACCVSKKGVDLQQFATAFSAQSVLPKIKDLHGAFTASVADEATQARVLEEVWFTAALVAELSPDERSALAQDYAFAFDGPVREYSQTEVPQRINATLWSYCARALDGAFFTMPFKSDGGDGSATVDADTRFDPSTSATEDTQKYMHGMERAVERILEKAKKHAPTFWTHAHRYMPSDSVWCEETAPRTRVPLRNATLPAKWNGLDVSRANLTAPSTDEVLYVSRLRSTCACGLQTPVGTCAVPPGLCARVSGGRWPEICAAGSYVAVRDAINVRIALYNHSDLLSACDEALPSTAWGLLDSRQQKRWYGGVSEAHNVSLQEIAALGPAGVRLAMFLKEHEAGDTAWRLRPAPLDGASLGSAHNPLFGHTVAQPFCVQGKANLFTEHLGEYFRDVLFPMAHAVHEAPSQVICARWVVEYALFVAVLEITGAGSLATAEQRAVEEIWRTRCRHQLEVVGLCHLRGVYGLVPPGTQDTRRCKFTVAPGECGKWFVTEACLLMCDGELFDPCLCDGAQACAAVFVKGTCTKGKRTMPLQVNMDLASLHWPTSVWPPSSAAQQSLDAFLMKLKGVDSTRLTLHADMFAFVRQQASRDEGVAPEAFCDDLIDYMDADAQHPVGYHPTSACVRAETNTRGFDAWMGRVQDSTHSYSIDPVRMRNMSLFSTSFGAAHLTCDAVAYSATGAELNPLRMQSKWSAAARADASMPVFADRSDEAGMAASKPAGDAYETPLQASMTANAAFRHSVGLVRDWLRDYENEADQAALDAQWPHWLDTTDARGETYAAPAVSGLHASCAMPSLLRCYEDSDCSSSDAALRCRRNIDGGALGDPSGICVHVDTCFQHAHCVGGKLCAGTGLCETPQLVVQNSLGQTIDVRVFAKSSTQCKASAFGSSAFQRVPTFARDNGLCGVANVFNYRNVTAGGTARGRLKTVAARKALFVPEALAWRALADAAADAADAAEARNALKMQAHACDRDYEHTDFAGCEPQSVPLDPAFGEFPTFSTTRTWRQDGAGTALDFCNLDVGRGPFNTLTSPYVAFDDNGEPIDSLKQTEGTIKPCGQFEFCPAPIYTVGGQLVDRLVWQGDALVKYPLSHAARCMSFGVWDGSQCRVDALIVPLWPALFAGATDVLLLEAPFEILRSECPSAFGAERADALNRFQSTFALLSAPYAPLNEAAPFDRLACERMTDRSALCVADTINRLLARIFDVEQGPQSQRRGITDLAAYKNRARCTAHLFRALQRVHKDNAARMAGFELPVERAPGALPYMFAGHFPVEVPLSWFFKCVLLSTVDEGGAPADWFALATDPLATAPLACPNVDRESAGDDTLRRHLQLQWDVYVSEGGGAAPSDVYEELLELMRATVELWGVTSIPTLVCRKRSADGADCDGVAQYSARDKACWTREVNTDAMAMSFHQDVLTACADSDRRCTLYDVMFAFIFGRSSKKLRENTVLTVDWLVEQRLAVRLGLDTRTSPTFSYANMIPEIEFARLYDLNASLIRNAQPGTYEVDYTGKTVCADRLAHAEYELMRRVVEAGEGEFRLYQRILEFREMAEAREQGNLEAYEHFDVLPASARAVSVSQKHMLLLALYYLRDTMYLGTSKTFGTMRYLPDVRSVMLQERAMARDLSLRVSRARFYDGIVKLQKFQCPEDKQIAEADASDLQRQLRSCVRELKQEAGWSVPSGRKLVARPNADVFLHGFYVSFAERPAVGFLDELVETDWHAQEAPRAGSLCFSTPSGAAPLTALWTGSLDLRSCPHGRSCGCQLASLQPSTYVDLTCDGSTDIASCSRDFPAYTDGVSRGMYEKCWRTQGEFAAGAADAGLCGRTPEVATQCRLRFGALGGITGSTASDLHKKSRVERTQEGLFSANSSLFRGERANDPATVTALKFLATDIGGHSMRLLARQAGGGAALDVTCVSAGRSCTEAAFSTWLPTISSAWAIAHNAHALRHNLGRYTVPSSEPLANWNCPMQWLSAYSDRSVTYSMRSPSPDRNRVRFRHLTGASDFAHATVVETRRVSQHPARFLSDHSACVDAVLDANGFPRFRCAGADLLRAALDAHSGKWTAARFVSGDTPPCKSMLDWPHVYARTVDGVANGAPEAAFYCNVFWRLPSFALRYVARASTSIPSKTRTSRATGGACHMGRLKRTKPGKPDSAQTQFCTDDDTHLRCRMLRRNVTTSGSVEHSWFEENVAFEAPFVPRRRKATRERRCSTCERHESSSFVDRHSRETAIENDSRNPAQLSVGVPTTVSTERLLAAALRRHACPEGPKAPCPAQYKIFGEDTWRRGKLLDAMLARAVQHQKQDSSPPNDDALWGTPWVKCERVQNVTSCRGSVSKAEWINPKTRVGACLREMRGSEMRGPSSMDFCSLSDETAELCRKVTEWNSEITGALCAAGNHAKCSPRAFYYNPSQYSASNKDFVHNSVVSLYAKLNASACPVEAQRQTESNAENLGRCASTTLEPAVFVVRLVRGVLRKLAMLLYYVGQVLFAASGVVVSSLAQAPATTTAYFADNLAAFVHLLLTVSAQALEQIWEVAWTLADFGELKFIRGLVQFVCYVIQYVVYPIIKFGLVPALELVIAFLTVLNDAICKISFGAVCNSIQVQVLQNVQNYLRQYQPRECESSTKRTPGALRDTLPAATRCWSTYNTYYGDSSRLSCTAADTCRTGPTDFSLTMCGACALTEDLLPFGCYDVTKTCTCGLPRLAEQGCTSNEECAAIDATCRFVDAELQPSLGFTPCASCQTRRVCLVTPGRSNGFCACGLVNTELQRCVAQAKPAMPAFDKLCVYTRDAAFLATTQYVFSFYTSMTAPCNDLNPASTFCARESSDGQLYAVGVDAVGRRRLLSAGAGDMTADDTHNSLCKDALSGDALPATREACRAAYAYSMDTLAQLGLDGRLEPCVFCSVEDAVHGLLLTPHNLVLLGSDAARVAVVLLRHTPLRVLVDSARRVRQDLRAAADIAAVEPALAVHHANGSWQVHVLVDHPSVGALAQVLEFALWLAPAPALSVSPKTNASEPPAQLRRLLSFDDVADAVRTNFKISAALRQTFATQLASTLDFSAEAPVAQREWLASWPPKLGAAALEDGVCPPLANMLRTTRRALGTIDAAYSMTKQVVPAAAVRDAWVNVSRSREANLSWEDYSAVRATNDPVTAGALFAAGQALAAVRLSPNSFFDVAAAAADELWRFFRCDYEAVQTCSKWRVRLVPAAIVVAVYYLCAYTLGASAGLSMPLLLAAGVLPSIVLYMSYGYSPMCFPAVPVCLYDDLVYSVRLLVPRSIALPAVMFRSEQCAAQVSGLTSSCLRTCTDEPFAFLEWYDVLAWWSLELGAEARLAELAQQPIAVMLLGPETQDDVLEALVFHARVFDAQDAALAATKRACAVLSLYKLVPHAVLLFFALMLVFASVQVLQQTVTVVVQTIFALLVSAFY
jgi:hypothetical protein